MSFYKKRILPRLLDLSMRQERLAAYRRQVTSVASGTVLEIGIGSGLNLPIYCLDVDCVYGVDPSAELLNLAQEKTNGVRFPILLLRASAECLPLKDHSIDTVVTTWTLCSIPDALKALREMRRVLRLQGRLLFVEHGLSPESTIASWQNWLTPCWKKIGGGCHLNRKMDDLIKAAGFHIVQLHTGYMKGPKPMTFMYQGRARRE